ncbi:cytochrome P450 4F12 [Coemansia mojavensis]|nr:cytochrome P450 4F12 [Coemansia mojavensis]
MPVLSALAALVTLIVYRAINAFYYSRFRHIPGSPISRITAKRAEVCTILGKMSRLGRHDFEKYGDIFVLTPDSICISNPRDIRALLANPTTAKSSYYNILRFTGIDNTVSAQDIELANTRHRQIGPFFKPTYLAKMEHIIIKHGIEAIKAKWDRAIADSAHGVAEVNFGHDFLLAAFDIIGTLVCGQPINQKTAQWIDTTLTCIGIRSMVQLVLPFTWPLDSRYNQLSDYIHKAIHRRREYLANGNPKPADLLQAFIDAEDPQSKVQMSHDQIHGECMLMMMAGSDTTSHTISWTVHFLMLYPHHYQRAKDEVQGKVTITYSDCRAHLPFIEACIFESLRLAPVTGGLLPRKAPQGGIYVQGHFIPEGTTIFVNLAAANHHPEYWQHPHEFNPLRFIENSDLKHNVLTFSHGRRTCPGKHLAMWEMTTILANIIKDYDMRLPPDLTHLGPHILNKHGYPRPMDSQQYIVVKPVDAQRDCRILISKR